MHKVVIERPRWNPGPDKNGRRANLPDELLPKFEGIKRPHRHRKGLTDLLGPLKRWLFSQVGRPWNDVYSEACAVIKADSVIRAHVKTHLLQFVERNTFMHEGQVCVLEIGYGARGIVRVDERSYRRNPFFLHPESNLLCALPQKSRKALRAKRRAARAENFRWLDGYFALKQIRGVWFGCQFRVVPPDGPFRAYDHALCQHVGRGGLLRRDGQYLHCIGKRQLSRRELRRYELKNVPVVEAQSSAGRKCGRLKTALRILADRRSWVIGHCRLAVSNPPSRCGGSSSIAERQCYPDRALPALSPGASTLMGRRHRVIGYWFESNPGPQMPW
jgi:hypothetical protein